MDISSSTESAAKWEAGVRVFSGRPDPVWSLDNDAAMGIAAVWDTLTPAAQSAPAPPALGYRGAWLRGPAGVEWNAFSGVVTQKREGRVEARVDSDRAFEKSLIGTAPAGILPDLVRDIIR